MTNTIQSKAELDQVLLEAWATPELSKQAYALYATGKDEELRQLLTPEGPTQEDFERLHDPTLLGLVWDDEEGWIHPEPGEEWKYADQLD